MNRRKLLLVIGLCGLSLSAGCASTTPVSRESAASPALSAQGGLASADPIGAALFAQPTSGDSPRPALASILIDE